MKNKMIKGLVALGMLLAGLAVVNTGSNVDVVSANVDCSNWWNPHPLCFIPPGNGGDGQQGPIGGNPDPGNLHPGVRPASIEIDITD